MSKENTVSKIFMNGTTYSFIDDSKASIESVEELTSISTNNNSLLSSAHDKIDELINEVNENSSNILKNNSLLSSIASIESVEELTSISTNNNSLLSSAHNKIDELINGVNENSSNILKNNSLLSSMYTKLDELLIKVGNIDNSSDLVALGILPKQIYQFTNDDIGTPILIPYTDKSGKIALNENGCIEFEVVAVDHHQDINNPTKPTITLMSKNILRYAAFDAKEPNNPNSDKAGWGNNRWSVSNIRQWMNSESIAKFWFTPQHEYDEAPNADMLAKDIPYNSGNTIGTYADDPGFLLGFSNEVKQHLATVRNKTVLCDADKELLSKDFEETEDKVFLPSYTEMGYGDLDINNPEGSHLAQRFPDYDSRIKVGIKDGITKYLEYYWLRSPYIDRSHCVHKMFHYDPDYSDNAYRTMYGIVPLLVLY